MNGALFLIKIKKLGNSIIRPVQSKSVYLLSYLHSKGEKEEGAFLCCSPNFVSKGIIMMILFTFYSLDSGGIAVKY